ncbi:YpbF family protein [Bacillus sp. CGMCC 1.16541]|uniref:YpbF family protein n=1 Tax=Bacillus sp. CGMCC 1.16541 TaxID=2185143 RepID=UPI000D73600F|nr:YpbF family protein [Bacillus sp. CGMCC 1.16541]
MERNIQKLHHSTDEPTKYMLQSVIERKKKFDGLKRKEKRLTFAFLGALILFGCYLFFSLSHLSMFSISGVIGFILNETYHLFMILAVMSLYVHLLQVHKKGEKAEKEFHDLRCEIIQKSKDLWPTHEKWESRHNVFELMKNEYDINLYHENK